MSPEPEKMKKTPRKHVTTACVPCRESKIRVGISSEGLLGNLKSDKNPSVTELLRIARTVSVKAKNANTSTGMTSASE